MRLKEGGNVFKKVDGKDLIPMTQRIATPDVQPTICLLYTSPSPRDS